MISNLTDLMSITALVFIVLTSLKCFEFTDSKVHAFEYKGSKRGYYHLYCVKKKEDIGVFGHSDDFNIYYYHRWSPIVHRWPTVKVAVAIGGLPLVHWRPITDLAMDPRWPLVGSLRVSVRGGSLIQLKNELSFVQSFMIER